MTRRALSTASLSLPPLPVPRLLSLFVLVLLVACDTAAPDPITYAEAEVKPVPTGGWDAFAGSVEYPEFASRAGIEGEVAADLVVSKDGAPEDITIVRTPNQLLSDASLDALREGAFEPGQVGGAPVAVRLTACVRFEVEAGITAGPCAAP